MVSNGLSGCVFGSVPAACNHDTLLGSVAWVNAAAMLQEYGIVMLVVNEAGCELRVPVPYPRGPIFGKPQTQAERTGKIELNCQRLRCTVALPMLARQKTRMKTKIKPRATHDLIFNTRARKYTHKHTPRTTQTHTDTPHAHTRTHTHTHTPQHSNTHPCARTRAQHPPALAYARRVHSRGSLFP
jgi:hypothetical protein